MRKMLQVSWHSTAKCTRFLECTITFLRVYYFLILLTKTLLLHQDWDSQVCWCWQGWYFILLLLLLLNSIVQVNSKLIYFDDCIKFNESVSVCLKEMDRQMGMLSHEDMEKSWFQFLPAIYYPSPSKMRVLLCMFWCSGAVVELCTDHVWTFETSVPVCDFVMEMALPWKYTKWRKVLEVKETTLDDQG